MDNQLLFNFKTDLSKIQVAAQLNNPFDSNYPEIARIAAKEFQEFIATETVKWNYDFSGQRGKMFGILVVQNEDKTYGYLGTNSGKLPNNIDCNKFVPSIFDDSTDDFFINKGMTALTEIGIQIKQATTLSEISLLKERRKQKSLSIQLQLFENYRFLNYFGKEKNVLEIFKDSLHCNPPSAAGECAAPKLLQYAFKKQLKPIALAEFWWGTYQEKIEREHKVFYPACKNKCRPILEFMLGDSELFNRANQEKSN